MGPEFDVISGLVEKTPQKVFMELVAVC